MKMIDVEKVVKEAASQMTGVVFKIGDSEYTGTEIEALDSFNIADLGQVVVGADGEVIRGTAESFLNAAISVIARIEVEARAYTGDMKDFMVRDDEWGGFLERVYFNLGDIITDPKWNLMANYNDGKVDYSEEEHTFYPAKAEAVIFQEAKAIMTPISRPTDQLKEAVRNASEMQSLLTGIQVAVRNTLEAGLQSMRHMLAQAAIAVSMKNTGTAINLLTRYNSDTGKSLKAANALYDEDFLKYASMIISETRDNMKTFNSAFNDGSIPTFTDDDYSKLILLNKFDKAVRFNVKASTFNKEDLAIGDYSTTTMWQGYNAGSGNDYDFGAVSTIKVAADEKNKLGIGTNAFEATGVIGLLFDKYALGICPFKRKVRSSYTAVGDFFNEWHSVLVNLILDKKFPIVAFYIADEDIKPEVAE